MSKQHTYRATVEWTGNLDSGTSSYTAYSRDYTVRIAGKPDLFGSSDPAFRGDEHRHNPEQVEAVCIIPSIVFTCRTTCPRPLHVGQVL